MKSYAVVSVVLASVLLSGCATVRDVNLSSNFDPDEAKELLKKGDNSIEGSALIRQAGGGVVTCAGQPVILVPATQYARERIEAIYGSSSGGFKPEFPVVRHSFTNDNPKYKKLTKHSFCDAQGRFVFKHVADGDFYLTTRIIWHVASYGPPEGGALAGFVSLSGGEEKDVVLSP